jgi:DNA polymerase-1
MALNAPIQGGASDIFKLAMIRVDRALQERQDLECRVLLTVHDELVFEVSAATVEDSAKLVQDEMESAYELDPPLKVDIGTGENWLDAK